MKTTNPERPPVVDGRWYHVCRKQYPSGITASIGIYLSADQTCKDCGATEAPATENP